MEFKRHFMSMKTARTTQPRQPSESMWWKILVWIPLVFSPIGAVDARDAREIVAGQCVACHGMDGNQPVPSFPKIAGIQEEYLAKQLIEIATGVRESPAMMPIVSGYSKAELASLAAYFASQRRSPGTVTNPALAEVGRDIFHEGVKDSGVPACAGCHRSDGAGTERSPMIAAQDATYTLTQLQNFQKGVRNNDRGRLMRTIAARLTEQEMRAVAEYIAGMPVSVAQR